MFNQFKSTEGSPRHRLSKHRAAMSEKEHFMMKIDDLKIHNEYLETTLAKWGKTIKDKNESIINNCLLGEEMMAARYEMYLAEKEVREINALIAKNNKSMEDILSEVKVMFLAEKLQESKKSN